jgi:uncharacterized protein (TIGR03435 family)
MKKLLYAACICLGIGANAQVKVGQLVPEATFTALLNAQEKSVPLSALRGKVVLIDFWATWCGACIKQMPHLQALQDTFKDKLRVVTVTAESADRIRQYLQNRPSRLWFAVDTARKFQEMFPFKIIPHAVLIDKDGMVRAITDPDLVTEKAIGDLIAGQPIDLPLKEDLLYEDPMTLVEKYVPATPQTASQLNIQPAIQGAPSFVHRYDNDPNFRNRRITMINVPFMIMYRAAYGDLSHLRTLDLRADRQNQLTGQSYCLDIIVAQGKEKELLPTLEKELNERFAIRGALEKQTKPVYVLQLVEVGKTRQLTPATRTEQYLMAQGNRFEGKEVTVKQLVDYLENFGIVDRPVVDGTGLTAAYNISLQFEPENRESLKAGLQRLGLRLDKSEREIQVLVLR